MSDMSLTLPTWCAHWGQEDHQYFGYPVYAQLMGRESVTGISALSVLGRRLSKEDCAVLDDIACVSTLADPRIWPLKMTRVVASFGSSMPAIAAGLLILESALIGPWKTTDAAIALAEMHATIDGRDNDDAVVLSVVGDYIKQHRIIPGYGAPFHDHDERLEALRVCMRSRNRDQMPHWRSMEAIAKSVFSLRRLHPNLGSGLAAALLDAGFSSGEVGPICTVLGQHMFYGNALEGARQSPAALRELPSSTISYIGKSRRVSPSGRRAAPGHSPQSRERSSTEACEHQQKIALADCK